jgi:hypothetical protein
MYILLFSLFIFVAIYLYAKYKSNDRAPWIVHKTALPLKITIADKRDIANSVDPGAHLLCEKQCKSIHNQSPDFMQICIDTCIQKLWTDKQ